MNNANRVVFNSAVLYAKIAINIVISLVSVPIIMHALGNSDYGLYSLVAGVIGLLAFLKSAMTVSTQRFISVAIGENKIEKINRIYNMSLLLHLVIGVVIVLVFELFALFMFDGFLNIEPDREEAAKIIYQFLVVTTFLEIACVPYEGVMNAKEDMLAFSIIGVVSAIFKLILALYLKICPFDRLVAYGLGMSIISLCTVTTYVFFTRIKYKEFTLDFKRYYDKEVMMEILGFTGWNTFGAIAVVGRNQGVAVVINKFFGTILNAAYGVSNQVNGVMSYFSYSFNKAIAPQLMKSYGSGDNSRMIKLAYITSKFSYIVMAFFTVPLIVEMPYILKLWLGAPPDYAIELCQWMLIVSLINEYSIGLMNAISASGNIRRYQIIMSILLLTNVPLSYIVFKMGFPPFYCAIVFVIVEIVSLAARLTMSQDLVGINVKGFIHEVIKPTLICTVLAFVPVLICHMFMESNLIRVVVVFAVFIVSYALATWYFSLSEVEKNVLGDLYSKILRKYVKKY